MTEDIKPQDGNENKGPVPTPPTDTPVETPPAQDAGGITDAKASELLAQKRKANKEAQDANKRNAELEAKLKEYEDRDKSELEKLQEKAAQAEAKLAQAEAEKAFLASKNIAISNGVEPQYADFVASELDKASPEDATKWFEEMKAGSPAFFGTKPRAPASAEGGADTSGGNGSTENRIKQLEDRLTFLSQPKHNNSKNEMEMFQIRRELKSLRQT